MAISNYDAAGNSEIRGRVFWLGQDSRQEISAYSRRELARKARAATANLPLAKRLRDALVIKTVGSGFRLQALTRDEKWNEERERMWENSSKSAGVFDVARKFNFWKMCNAVLRGQHEDGDAFVLKSAAASGAARFLFYEGLRVGNGSRMKAGDDRWQDGVLTDRHSAALKYRFMDGNDSQDIDAAKVIAFIDHERPGHVRGVSRMGVCLNDLWDRAEIKGFVKHGVKVAAQFGVVQKGGASSGPAMAAVAARSAGPMPATAAEMRKEELELQRLFGGGKVINLGKDGSIETVKDDRPQQNYQVWDEQTIVREIALGYGLPMEVVWNIAKLGGTAGRYVLADAQQFVEREQQNLIDLFCAQVYIYDTASLLSSGMLRAPDDPQWWLHGWLTPPKLTVDVGRDGKLQMERQRRALLTMKSMFGCEGLDWKRQVSQWLVEREFVLDGAMEVAKRLEAKHGVEVSLDRVLPPEPGAPASPGDGTELEPDAGDTPEKADEEEAEGEGDFERTEEV